VAVTNQNKVHDILHCDWPQIR